MRDLSASVRPASSDGYPWYDSQWLTAYHRARGIVTAAAPGRLREFDAAFDVLRTAPKFEARVLERVFDDATLDEIRRVAASLEPSQLELHEARSFRRFVVHDHPYFNAMQAQVVEIVSEAAGEPVEPSYNFLSLYGPLGICPLHLDAPLAKWTLDLCLSQSDAWPIYFAPVAPWPEPGMYGPDWEAQIKQEVGGGFVSHTLVPGQSVLFSGSSQWHYRDAMPGQGPKKSCDLLFFHFIPAGTSQLVQPHNWAQLFGIPELASESKAVRAAD